MQLFASCYCLRTKTTTDQTPLTSSAIGIFVNQQTGANIISLRSRPRESALLFVIVRMNAYFLSQCANEKQRLVTGDYLRSHFSRQSACVSTTALNINSRIRRRYLPLIFNNYCGSATLTGYCRCLMPSSVTRVKRSAVLAIPLSSSCWNVDFRNMRMCRQNQAT